MPGPCIMDSQPRQIQRLTDVVVSEEKRKSGQLRIVWETLYLNRFHFYQHTFGFNIVYLNAIHVNIVLIKCSVFLKAFHFQLAFSTENLSNTHFLTNSIQKCFATKYCLEKCTQER